MPDGPHDLLTSAVLAQQQHLAPLRDVRIGAIDRTGDTARVQYTYALHLAAGTRQVTGRLRVERSDGRWRLAGTAVSTALQLDQARDRMAFADSTVPDGRTLLFPGALPVRFDTPYLHLDPDTATVGFDTGSTTRVRVEPTDAARAMLLTRLARQLAGCLSGTAAPASCPMPPSGIVPGSLRGRLVDGVDHIALRVGSAAPGTIELTGAVNFRGSYQRLDYDNVVHRRSGGLSLPVDAWAYAVAPLAVRFASAT